MWWDKQRATRVSFYPRFQPTSTHQPGQSQWASGSSVPDGRGITQRFFHYWLIPHGVVVDVVMSRNFRQSQKNQFHWYFSCNWCVELMGWNVPQYSLRRITWLWMEMGGLYCCSVAPWGPAGQCLDCCKLLSPSDWGWCFYWLEAKSQEGLCFIALQSR